MGIVFVTGTCLFKKWKDYAANEAEKKISLKQFQNWKPNWIKKVKMEQCTLIFGFPLKYLTLFRFLSFLQKRVACF